MRIALNAQLLSRAQSFRSAGINRVIYHLLAELSRDPRGHSYDVFAPSTPVGLDESRPSMRFHTTGDVTIRRPVRILWEQTLLPINLVAHRPALVHALAYATPLLWPGISVLTVYDMSFARFPRAFNLPNRLYLTAATRLSARRVRRIITISEFSRREIARLLHFPAHRIDVAYPAADTRFRQVSREERARFRAEHDLPDRFLFSVGTLEPRKNLTGLLQAYAKLASPRVPLYVAGAAGWRFSPILQEVERLGLAEDIRFLGYVPEEDLPLWYNCALFFTYPSLYEGFGLPVLEAMACGTPVITSDAASLPEVAGTAGILVPAGDSAYLSRAMQALLNAPDERRARSEAGLTQARKFSWANMADETVRTYMKASARTR